MILNGRRIEQRTEMALEGGADWLRAHLTLSEFDPIDIDGRDPAAFAWAILEMESRLSVRGEAAASGKIGYPVPLPYAIANTIKGYGFPGAGTNRAHNLPLAANPSQDIEAKEGFNAGAAKLWVEPDRLAASAKLFHNHDIQRRVLERDHPLACRFVAVPRLPEWKTDVMPPGTKASPMEYLDRHFVEIVKANPELRPRVGNPDELQSNRMGRTLEYLKHRVNRPEPSVAEAVNGAIITVLNEEAVIGAVLGNKGGINIAVTYEAFAVKMLGAVRQEIIFGRAKKERGYAVGWLAIPVVVTSHAWENGKNEQSHQDPTCCEAMLGEMSDTARVFFPADACSAVLTLSQVYREHDQIACIVAPKREVAALFSRKSAEALVARGAQHVDGNVSRSQVQLVAIGAYQLEQCLRAAARLAKGGLQPLMTYMLEPGKFRTPRDAIEAAFVASDDQIAELFPAKVPRVIVTHTRPEPMAGVLRRFDSGPQKTRYLGYCNRGGTLDTAGLLFANGATWAHIITEACRASGLDSAIFLSKAELLALSGQGDPKIVMQ